MGESQSWPDLLYILGPATSVGQETCVHAAVLEVTRHLVNNLGMHGVLPNKHESQQPG